MHPVELFTLYNEAIDRYHLLSLSARSHLARNRKKTDLEQEAAEAKLIAEEYARQMKNLLSGMHPGGFYILSSK